MKEYNCPDCKLQTNTCCGCPRMPNISNNPYYEKKNDYLNTYTNFNEIPNPCKNCPNHPSNGGSGLCNCTLGSMIFY